MTSLFFFRKSEAKKYALTCFIRLTLECQEGRTDKQIVVKCIQQSIIPIGTTFVYAILVFWHSQSKALMLMREGSLRIRELLMKSLQTYLEYR